MKAEEVLAKTIAKAATTLKEALANAKRQENLAIKAAIIRIKDTKPASTKVTSASYQLTMPFYCRRELEKANNWATKSKN